MTNALLVLGLWAILGAAVAVTVNILQARARSEPASSERDAVFPARRGRRFLGVPISR
jgi:hypothetical protein